ncbi:MAG: tetratricopeptide repeat protein [Candidatus Sericytochromatia bacterium]
MNAGQAQNPARKALYRQGLGWLQAGDFAQAQSCFEKLVSQFPDAGEGWYQLGCLSEDSQRARVLLERALHLLPGFGPARLQLGLVLLELGEMASARTELRQAAEGQNPPVEAPYHLSQLAALEGDYAAAIRYCRAALALKPDFHEASFQLAWLLSLSQPQQAAEIYLDLLARGIEPLKSLLALGKLAEQQGRIREARDYYRQALEREPGPLSLYQWGSYLQASGETEAAARTFASALKNLPPGLDQLRISAARIISLYCSPEVSDPQLIAAVRNFESRQVRHLYPARRPAAASQTGPLRWGYVSPDCFQHVAGHTLRTLLRHHDPAIELHVFALPGRVDPMTYELQTLARHWHWLDSEDMHANADLIRRQGIDVLVDMAGFTSHSLLSLFAYRPAPVQLTGLGLPLPTDMPVFDAFVTDAVCLQSPLLSQATFAEIPLCLPSWLCWQPPQMPIPLRQGSGSPACVFGSALGLPKLNPLLLVHWAELLRQCPQSRLLIKAGGLKEDLQRRIQAAFAETASRVSVEPLSGYGEYLDFYNRVDCILDGFPYPGGNTSCEALWMGVPVLTLPGRHAGGVSLVRQAGHPEWAAADLQDYLRRGQELARLGPRSLSLRQQLRHSFEQTPACRPAICVRALEQAAAGLLAKAQSK